MTPADHSSPPAPQQPHASSVEHEPIPSAPPGEGDDSSIALAPLKPAARESRFPERLTGDLRHLDLLLVSLMLAFAFLLASFAARNADLWMHLASGRLLAHGQYTFYSEQFSYTATGWVNNSWLWDLLLYGLATLGGGPEAAVGGAVLVVVKALLVTGLAWLIFQTRRPDSSLWAPALCTGLALLTISPRLDLRPIVISLLFLAATLYILQSPRNREGAERRRAPKTRSPLLIYWLLPPLFVLWVNFDTWFLLGPFTVALYLVGQGVQSMWSPIRTGPDAPEPKHLVTLTAVLIVGLAACLLNPYHYGAFAAPLQLSASRIMQILERDFWFRLSYRNAYEAYFGVNRDTSIAGLAYIPLVVLGVCSFILTIGNGWRWWRFFIWLPFCLLSLYHVRDIPFFAVVAAPLTALNLQDFALTRFGRATRAERGWLLWSLGGRMLTALLLILCLAADWPGWLHVSALAWDAESASPHRVEWTVEVAPSLRKAAEQIRDWHRAGQLGPNDRCFNYSPDIAYYCAWFCCDDKGLPLERAFYDHRFQALTPQTAKEIVDARLTLRNYSIPTENLPGDPEKWQKIFERHAVNHVVLSSSDLTYVRAWGGLLHDWQQWSLLYMDGRTTIFGWNGAKAPPRIERVDFERRAFGADTEPAPKTGPERAPREPDLWTRFSVGLPLRPLAADEASNDVQVWLEANRQAWQPELAVLGVANWGTVIGDTIATPAAASVSAPATGALHWLPVWAALKGSPAAKQMLMSGRAQGPFGALMVAVRAARRAIAADPDGAAAYFLLGRAYSSLWRGEEESWTGATPFSPDQVARQKLRFIQAVTALEYGLKLRPDDAEAHSALASLYRSMNYIDLATDHLRDYVNAARAAGPQPDETRDDFRSRMEALDKGLKNDETFVITRLNEYDLAASNQPLSTKVQQALAKGLGKRARDLLMEADASQMEVPDRLMQLQLLLLTGQPDKIIEEVTPEAWSHELGPMYDWFGFLRAAAMGDYDEAKTYLDPIIARLERSNADNMVQNMRAEAFPPSGHFPGDLRGINNVINNVRQLADLQVIRGMMATEAGDIDLATRSFRAALDTVRGQNFSFESRPIAYYYLAAIEKAGRGK
jgi:tetratricopeptide (TPR) repeat protein